MAQPNILLLMADQLTAFALQSYGNTVCKTPNIAALAASGTVFENAYCNFPLCGPSRYAMMSGRLASRVGSYDNACEFPADTPTLAYYLGSLGYQTSLSGKMHFVGPDQMHGYQQRLTTDIYPSDFGWTPDWTADPPHAPSGMSMRSVVESGICTRSLQFDYDDEVAHCGVQKIYDLARQPAGQPFFLTVAFTHPHNPYVTSRRWWDLYEEDAIDPPRTPAMPYDALDAHAKRLHWLFRQDEHVVAPDDVRRARHAYYANTSYVDHLVGKLLHTLAETGLDKNTIVVFTSDHGDMLGERGLWYKYTLRDPALRIPLIMRVPAQSPLRCPDPVSHIDLLPTLTELAQGGTRPFEPIDPLDGTSLVPLMEGHRRATAVTAEFNGEGAIAPMVAVIQDKFKLIVSPADPAQLFDLENDPSESRNLSGTTALADIESGLMAEVRRVWNLDKLHKDVLASQRRRRWIQDQRESGKYAAWDFQPLTDASRQYVRNGGSSSPTMVKGLARYPYVPPKQPDRPRKPSDAK